VPEARLEERYPRTLKNLPAAVDASSVALLLDNDRVDAPYRFVALFEQGRLVRRSALAPEWARGVLGPRPLKARTRGSASR
jgi:predicted ABC-type ATPase